MPTLEDNMQFGDAEAVSTHLKKRVVELEDLANHLRKQRTLGERSVVLPNIVQCASRQLQILEASTNLPLEVAAGACRTAFELCVRTLVLEKRPDTIMDFWIERLYDEKSLVSAFQRLTHERTTAEDLEMLSSRIAQLDDYTITHKLKKPITSSMFKLAEAAAGVVAPGVTARVAEGAAVAGAGAGVTFLS